MYLMVIKNGIFFGVFYNCKQLTELQRSNLVYLICAINKELRNYVRMAVN